MGTKLLAGLIVLIVIGIIIGCVLIGRKKSATDKRGEAGEETVARILGDTVSGKQYVINDLLFCDANGNSCQIDHVYINRNGIWVIETKNYSGSIYGTEAQREWTQVLAYGKTKHQFYNPVKQNATHIYHLTKYLKVNHIFHNVVVFLSDANLANVHSENVYTVYRLSQIKTRKTDVSLTVEQMESYYKKLSELKNRSKITEKEHVQNIQKKQDGIRKGICPRCGGNLVLRNGKNGQFFGCSNYPRCKFTMNIE